PGRVPWGKPGDRRRLRAAGQIDATDGHPLRWDSPGAANPYEASVVPTVDAVRSRRRRIREDRGDDETARDDGVARRAPPGDAERGPRQGRVPHPRPDSSGLRGGGARPRGEDGDAGPRARDGPRRRSNRAIMEGEGRPRARRGAGDRGATAEAARIDAADDREGLRTPRRDCS